MQDLGSKLRMVVMAHRRITLKRKHEETDEKKNPKESAMDPVLINSDPVDIQSPFAPKPEVPVEFLLQVETENLVHEPFETTDEVKALTQEIIKTIRDIIVSFCCNFSQILRHSWYASRKIQKI